MTSSTRLLKQALIVEDDAGLANALARSVRERGIEARIASTLQAARALLDDNIDLALIDIRLPDGSGLDLCRELCDRVPRPVVVAISGAASGKDGFALARLGVGEYIEKPFDDHDLWHAIEKNAGVPLAVAATASVGAVKLPDAQRAVRRAMIKEAVARGGSTSDIARLLGVTRQAAQQILESLDDDG